MKTIDVILAMAAAMASGVRVVATTNTQFSKNFTARYPLGTEESVRYAANAADSPTWLLSRVSIGDTVYSRSTSNTGPIRWPAGDGAWTLRD